MLSLSLAVAMSMLQDLRPTSLTTCTRSTATPVTTEQLWADIRRFSGRCVTVAGPTYFYRMFSSVPGIYLATRRGERGYVPVTGLRHRIGLYFGDESAEDPGPSMPEILEERFHHLEVTGIVDSCERMGAQLRAEGDERNRRSRAAGSDTITISMLGGYCHYDPGPVVWVTERTIDPSVRYERLNGRTASAFYGSLIEATRDWRFWSFARRRGLQFQDAIASADRQRLATLHGKFGATQRELAYLLDDPGSPFRELRSGARRPMQILVDRFDRDGTPPAQRTHPDAVICYCRTEDCSGRWPIAPIDTQHDIRHPYVCIEMERDGAGEDFLRSGAPGPSETVAAPLLEPEG